MGVLLLSINPVSSRELAVLGSHIHSSRSEGYLVRECPERLLCGAGRDLAASVAGWLLARGARPASREIKNPYLHILFMTTPDVSACADRWSAFCQAASVWLDERYGKDLVHAVAHSHGGAPHIHAVVSSVCRKPTRKVSAARRMTSSDCSETELVMGPGFQKKASKAYDLSEGEIEALGRAFAHLDIHLPDMASMPLRSEDHEDAAMLARRVSDLLEVAEFLGETGSGSEGQHMSGVQLQEFSSGALDLIDALRRVALEERKEIWSCLTSPVLVREGCGIDPRYEAALRDKLIRHLEYLDDAEMRADNLRSLLSEVSSARGGG